ncbi:MAG: ATP-binding cassette domain-containing protein [Ruminococcaceae bacterium]|nr:ATP-binding cassette domain-containing protein [Oscillospiraceae bacterium]
MIEVSSLSKRYGNHLAVDNVSFSIEKGEIVGFLGPNGAGKSTIMNIMTGYLSLTDGSVSIDGFDISENPEEAKKRIGYLPEIPPLYIDMTVKEYLYFIYDLKKVSFPKKPHIEEIARVVKIDNVYNRLIKNLSKGYRQRVGIAQALIGNPDLLILDEPTVGLDPKQILEIRNLIARLGKNHTIILSSHILSEIQEVCERVIIINQGHIVADDTPENLSKNLSDDHSLSIRVKGTEGEILKILNGVPGIKEIRHLSSKEAGTVDFILEPKAGHDIRAAVSERLAERKKTLLSLTSNEMTLEQIFLRITEGTATEKLVKKADKKTDSPKVKFDLESGEAVIGEETKQTKEFSKKEDDK